MGYWNGPVAVESVVLKQARTQDVTRARNTTKYVWLHTYGWQLTGILKVGIAFSHERDALCLFLFSK